MRRPGWLACMSTCTKVGSNLYLHVGCGEPQNNGGLDSISKQPQQHGLYIVE